MLFEIVGISEHQIGVVDCGWYVHMASKENGILELSLV